LSVDHQAMMTSKHLFNLSTFYFIFNRFLLLLFLFYFWYKFLHPWAQNPIVIFLSTVKLR